MTYGSISRERAATSISPREWSTKITEYFWLLARNPYLGRARDEDLRLGLRSFPAGDYLIIHRIVEDDVVLILHVVHGRRDIARLFGDWS